MTMRISVAVVRSVAVPVLALTVWTAGPSDLGAQTPEAVVTGVVTDEAGRPIPQVLVFIDDGMVIDSTGAAGAFRLDGVSSGSRRLGYRKDGFAPRTLPVEVVAGATQDIGVVVLSAGAAVSATLTGAVVNSNADVPLSGATVVLNGAVVGTTDARGVFEASNVPVRWGSNTLRITYRSLADATLVEEFLILEPDQTVAFRTIGLDVPPVPLDPIDVTVEAAPVIPVKLQPFYERMAETNGTFLTREDFEERNPRTIVAALRGVQGIRISPPSVDGDRVAVYFSRSMLCTPVVFLDGLFVGGGNEYVDIDALAAMSDVEGIELYGGISQIPIELNRAGSLCGVIVIWTR